ncbi:hypothetical protein IT570_06030 [Candidatus Sumerlaeota bacterium]|nr:hypothetical protein [Candidatus Sumerlaeota bacterium]
MGFFKKLFSGDTESKKAPPAAAPPPETQPATEVPAPATSLSAIDWHEAGQKLFFEQTIRPQVDESLLKFVKSIPSDSGISAGDVLHLAAMVGALEPTRMLEIGGGHSTQAIHFAKVTRMLPGELITADANPSADVTELVDAHLAVPVQQVLLEDFQSLNSGEMLIIDLKKLAANRADVLYVLRDILPKVNSGVIVGVHGIDLFHSSGHDPISPLRDVKNLLLGFFAEASRCEVLQSSPVPMEDVMMSATQQRMPATIVWFRIK